MTYKLNPIIEKTESPVRILLPENEQRNYESSTAACCDSFDRNLIIEKIRADGGTVVITLVEADVPGNTK